MDTFTGRNLVRLAALPIHLNSLPVHVNGRGYSIGTVLV
ncbi:hypothetical protein ABID62_002816 [Bradyrhizobium sp. S3.9.1]